MTNPRSCFVHGTPAPQGSKRHVGGGRMIESSAKVKPWREAVKWAWLDQNPGVRFDGPVVVTIVFTVRKPASAPKRTRTWPDRKPDLDKLVRSTLDALTDAGALADDARVVELTTAKRYPGEGPGALSQPGAAIVIRTLTEGTEPPGLTPSTQSAHSAATVDPGQVIEGLW